MRLPVTARTSVLRALRDEVRARCPRGRVVLAVDGVDGAGKTIFADGLAEAFAEEGTDVFRASIEGFHRPRAERPTRGEDSGRGRYEDSYDYSSFRRVLIDPFREGSRTAASIGFQLAAWDAVRDAPVEARWVTGPADAVLVVDGVFLHRPQLADIWDWSVWLDTPPDVASARMALRDGSDPDPDAPGNRYRRRGQESYMAEVDPRNRAAAVIDNTDPESPRRVLTGSA
ncbi:uridine kinase [Microbacterium limosum]|uniref:Uridine kinase n=1 Tax=Microbacterium limosum TaxID=3079935 RepID=A0AAU0MEJ1_9MICO|nr:uridine kinase [Microbacterium sp. Y20]WOQ68668.1 uridine kinase [Microbacterium sp. Y20]